MIISYIILFIPPIIGLIFSLLEWLWISKINLSGPKSKILNIEDGLKYVDKMKEVSSYISKGSNAFLKKEYEYLSVFIIIFFVLLGIFVDIYSAISFVLGSLTSILCGYIGMKIAVFANVRSTNETWKSLNKGYIVTVNAGTVMGFSLVSLSIISMGLLIIIYKFLLFNDHDIYYPMLKIAGFGLGGSSIALFSRVGGGIYTKAADVGADLSGKNEYGIPEDDIRNPACIADNVGDNVGDMAGMGADLFGSLAESVCASLIVGSSVITISKDSTYDLFSCVMFPLLFISLSILVGIITFYIVTLTVKIKQKKDVEKSLKYLLILSTMLQTIIIISAGYFFIPNSVLYDSEQIIGKWNIMLPALIGLWSGLIIGYTAEYYTSYSYKPVQEIANTQKLSAATGIIYGLSLGYKSTLIPIIFLSATLGFSYILCNIYGISLAAVGMLSTLCICLTIDSYGPISDNAGGIAEMAGLPAEVRERTDILDAAGNTTAAIGKGFAIGSAALVNFALFSAYLKSSKIYAVNILNPWVIIGLLIGAMLPYFFSSLTMKSVAIAASSVLNECLEQFPLILSEKQKPDYEKCVKIATDASLKQMILPGIISIFSPLLIGLLLGKFATAGLLVGILASGIPLAISSTNAGGAWDNAKKYIESGALGRDHMKGSSTHKNSVIGDTVGDPLKDTSGPSLNILIKLSAITSLVFADLIALHFTSSNGGPIWLK